MSSTAEALSIERITHKFLGAWKLVAYESDHQNGEVVIPFTDNPVGYVIYDKSGHFSLSMMHPGDMNFENDDILNASSDETYMAFYTRVAYAGQYEFDLKKKAIIHKVEICSIPNLVNTDQYRFFTITDTKLTLVTPELLIRGDQVVQTVRWERV